MCAEPIECAPPLVTVCDPQVHAVPAGEGVCAEQSVCERQRPAGEQQAGAQHGRHTQLDPTTAVEYLQVGGGQVKGVLGCNESAGFRKVQR